MRPITRPTNDVTYYNNSLGVGALGVGALAGGIGATQKTRCLALAINTEIARLNASIIPLAGGEPATAAAIVAQIAAAAIPVCVPTLMVGGLTYDAALAALPAANRKLVDNYCHYNVIQRNLQYDIAMDNWAMGAVPQLIIGDIPYAVSAMQDARELVRAVAGGAGVLYSVAGGAAATIGAPVGVMQRRYDVGRINSHINAFYVAWETAASAAPLPYRWAAVDLVAKFGPYCAYCEANIRTQIDVEHVLPKGKGNTVGGIRQGFSSHAKSWLNFLPSCTNCNSGKLSHPTKRDITNLAAGGAAFTKDDNTVIPVAMIGPFVGGGDARITDKEYARLAEDYYQFDSDPMSYQNVGFVLVDVTAFPVMANNTAIAAQINWRIHAINEEEKSITVNSAALAAPPILCNYRVYIDDGRYVPAPHPLPTPYANIARVQSIVDLCNLNTVNGVYIDTNRRVLERTEAWFMALSSINQIRSNLAAFPVGTAAAYYDLVYNTWKTNIIRTIKEKGFISVWLKIFSVFPHPLTGLGTVPTFPAPLAHPIGGAVAGAAMTLVQDIANQIFLAGYYPSTNYTNFPQ